MGETLELEVPISIFENGTLENSEDIPVIEVIEEYTVTLEPITVNNGIVIPDSESDYTLIYKEYLTLGLGSELIDKENSCDESILCWGPAWMEIALFVISALILLGCIFICVLRCCCFGFVDNGNDESFLLEGDIPQIRRKSEKRVY